MHWQDRRALVTGGASFIGSHLVDALIARGARVRVVDDFSSGRRENLEQVKNGIELIEADLLEPDIAQRAVADIEVVFHLAAIHGGRGFLERHNAACSQNLTMDGLVFRAARLAGVDKIVYASSGCVYPNSIQTDPNEVVYLAEDLVKPPYDADNLYGWAKLMAELSLRAYHEQWGIKTASCRYFTVYGERGLENHAVIAMIARTFIKQDPFVVWGTGEQIRNWTHVDDIVSGTLLAAERIDDGTAVNLGTMERRRVIDVAREVQRYTGHGARIETALDMPTGPYNRVADNSLAKRLLAWQPTVEFVDGLHRTIDWYYATKDPTEVLRNWDHNLGV